MKSTLNLSVAPRRWTSLGVVLFALLALVVLPGRVQANDYLEKSEHYTVQSMGQGVLRFTIPLWVYGSANDYYNSGTNNRSSNDDSYVWYSESSGAGRGSSSVHRIVSVAGARYGKNDTDGAEGQGYVYVHEGSIIIKSTYNGADLVLTAGDATYWTNFANAISLKRKNDDDHKRITYLTFDWYPPSTLQKRDFYWGVSANVHKKSSGQSSYKFWWNKPDKFKGGEIPQSPELFQPYLYALDHTGSTGYGNAAVQYAVYQEPISYHTSLNSTEVTSTDRSGTIVVPTADSVQRLMSATFYVYTNKDADLKQSLKTNEVHIPAYHRIYDFLGTEVLDEQNSVTGMVNLSWTIRNPHAEDLVEGDVFEVQRALKEDFSDAQTIEVKPYTRDTATYSFEDDPLTALRGDTSTLPTMAMKLQQTGKFVVNDANGEPVIEYVAKLTSERVSIPGIPVYYRVRRASSSVWGWEHDFAKATTLKRNAYLAPLDRNQPDYTLDPDYAINRKVHFRFRIDNSLVSLVPDPINNCEMTSWVNRVFTDSVTIPVLVVSYVGLPDSYTYQYRYVEPESQHQVTRPVEVDDTRVRLNLTVPTGAYNLELGVNGTFLPIRQPNSETKEILYPFAAGLSIERNGSRIAYGGIFLEAMNDDLMSQLLAQYPLPDDVKEQLYTGLIAQVHAQNESIERCSWDKNALLYLTRTAIETGDVIERVVPSDSIIRQADGSWQVNMTDVADIPCVHYRYSVRIDDSNSALKFANREDARPVPFAGPDLYFNAAAHVTDLQASQGTDMYGILLTWAPTGGGVDEYKIARRRYSDGGDFARIDSTTETDYRDLTPEPGMDYEYQVTAVFTCNDTTTQFSDTTIGRRSPYGKIGGRIHYEDGTGCANVDVNLRDNVTGEERTCVTNEAGEYLFDQLLYYYTLEPEVQLRYSQDYLCPDPSSTTRIRLLDGAGNVLQDWQTMAAGTYRMVPGTVVEAKCSHTDVHNRDEVQRVVVTGRGTLSCETKRKLVKTLMYRPFFCLYFAGDGTGGDKVTSTTYSVTPTSQSATFHYNNTTEGSATITLSPDNPVAGAIEFDNISSVRFSGRVLYKNSTIPVRDAYLLLNGNVVKSAGGEVRTDVSGNFTINVPANSAFTIRVAKDGHTFEGDGFVRIDGDSLLTLTKPLDGVRVWDNTKVRLAGRVTGGRNQAAKPLGFGLSTNNLGDNIQLVLELEGDNISLIVRDPDDLTKDTMDFVVPHSVYPLDGASAVSTTGTTRMHYQKKRIILLPDPVTGEYCADLYPVRYKVVQATATGYATLFAEGKTSETIDLSDAAYKRDSAVYDSKVARWNERFNITYRSPISISCIQMRYGMEQDFYGEETFTRQNILNENVTIPLAKKDSNGVLHYLFGAPVFASQDYRFRVTAHEDYYYNNQKFNQKHEEVRISGGTLKVYNGMHDAGNTQTFSTQLNSEGQVDITIPVDYTSFLKTGESALRVLDLSVESDGQYVEFQPFRAYVMGNRAKGRDFLTRMDGKVNLLDVLRDPPGAHSYAYLESGTTYKYNYVYTFSLRFGLELGAKYGTANTLNLGTYAGAGGGVYTGYTMTNTVENSFALPITSSLMYKRNGSYSFTTTDRIETGSDTYHVGSDGDVYIGTTQSVYFGLSDAVKPIDSLTYSALAAQLVDSVGANGTARVVAEGRGLDGEKYYLVIGEETEAGTYVDGSFAYTEEFIFNTVLPKLIRERDALLVTGDSATVQAIADARNSVVYWSKVAPDARSYAVKDYRKLYPNGVNTGWIDVDEVAQYNKQILNWIDLIRQNEKEKLGVIYGVNADLVGNYSVSNSIKESHSETYEYNSTLTLRWDYPSFTGKTNMNILSPGVAGKIAEASQTFADKLNSLLGDIQDNEFISKDPTEIDARMPNAKWSFSLLPILDINFDRDPNKSTTNRKTAGFVLEADEYSYMNVTVARMREPKNAFNTASADDREFISEGNDYNSSDYQYGSYVYMLNGGATKCPWEAPQEARFYEQGGQPVYISRGTLSLENPKLDINVHERSDVPHDKPAIFNLRITNELEQNIGVASIVFNLKLVEGSNPKGAKIYVDGMPLTGEGRPIRITTGQIINKTMEVYAGEGYDYENIVVQLASTCDVGCTSNATFSVHYMPVSCEVNISAPHDRWTMNTLSPKDSAGYYLPVVIDGFDVNYPGFDHIELQYKLSKNSDDGWVNLCSYYADDSLYQAASGSKAMIAGGRITNIRFYGERDPMEQQYDLRAVSFCRHGSTFLTRASAVRTGIKDTRPPQVFGEPEPANSILGVGDHLKLRFNEPIAGNYLDEDNNFQLLGVTNETDFTTDASVYFPGAGSYAETKVSRNLSDKSFSIDMMVKPAVDANDEQILFEHFDDFNKRMLFFGIDEQRRLFLHIGSYFLGNPFDVTVRSLPLEALTAFTRVIVTYDNDTRQVGFFAGTKNVTDLNADRLPDDFRYQGHSPFFIGGGYKGNLLETRVWLKVLTPAEVEQTAKKRLSGYERELVAYYPMNEGRGDILNDRANGATLYTSGTSWTMPKGISVAIGPDRRVELDNRYLSRSDIQDETFMLWFTCNSDSGHIFSANWTPGDSIVAPTGTLISVEDNRQLILRSGRNKWLIAAGLDGTWHHLVLSVNRTFNNVSVFLDGKMTNSFPATQMGGISGAMFFGGNGFAGNVDELTLYEQALPKSFVEQYDNFSPAGDEMGLMAYLPFEEQRENQNGIMELVFSVNDQRVFRTSDGQVVNKVLPLIADSLVTMVTGMADKTNYAPVRNHGLLTKLNFNWAFNNDELLINIKNADYEINKQAMFVTVRDVEDLNGNPMPSPVMWTAFVDHNSLKWEDREAAISVTDTDDSNSYSMNVRFSNLSGKRHQYTVESVPEWLTVKPSFGSVDPTGYKDLEFIFAGHQPVGTYSDIVYLTDEDGLSEPLNVEYTVYAECPYSQPDENRYPLNMSVCGQVFLTDPIANDPIAGAFDTDSDDKVIALCHNECVGMANIDFNEERNTSRVHLSVFGNESMTNKELTFLLWQASTGKVYNLTSSRPITFAHGYVYGCGAEDLVSFTTSGSETQNISIYRGWSWISTHLNLRPDAAQLNSVMFAAQAWTEGDLIKNPATRQFSSYTEAQDEFVGTLTGWDYTQMYMVYSAKENILRLSGNKLSEGSMSIVLHGDGRWNALPCLLDRTTPVVEAMADYYDNATPGDIVKNRGHFAYFTQDKHWEGDLTALRPGEGYLMRRLGAGDVTMRFFNTPAANAPKRAMPDAAKTDDFNNPDAATNMTIIARLADDAYGAADVSGETADVTGGKSVHVSVAGEQAGVARPVMVNGQPLFFITVQSDRVGELQFESDGRLLQPVLNSQVSVINYQADSHVGTPGNPLLLQLTDIERPYKMIEDDHVVIIRGGRKYDITGIELTK